MTEETFALWHEESGGTRISVTRFCEFSPVVYIGTLGHILPYKGECRTKIGILHLRKKVGCLVFGIFSQKNLVTMERMEICFYGLERG
jgi:hypothetical protein